MESKVEIIDTNKEVLDCEDCPAVARIRITFTNQVVSTYCIECTRILGHKLLNSIN